jgi:hypothetical protein
MIICLYNKISSYVTKFNIIVNFGIFETVGNV